MKEVIIPKLTDEEFSLYNDVNKMNKLIDEFLDKVIFINKPTHKNITCGELKHKIEHWANIKKYGGNCYILGPYLVKRLYEKKVPLTPYKFRTGSLIGDDKRGDYTPCFVGISRKSMLKASCFVNGYTPDDDFKSKPFDWAWHYMCLGEKHYERLRELGYGKLYHGSEHNWERQFEKRMEQNEKELR